MTQYNKREKKITPPGWIGTSTLVQLNSTNGRIGTSARSATTLAGRIEKLCIFQKTHFRWIVVIEIDVQIWWHSFWWCIVTLEILTRHEQPKDFSRASHLIHYKVVWILKSESCRHIWFKWCFVCMWRKRTWLSNPEKRGSMASELAQ